MKLSNLGLKGVASLLLASCLSWSLASCAGDNKADSKEVVEEKSASEPKTVDKAVQEAIIAKLKSARPDLEYTDVLTTPVPELFEVRIAQGGSVYSTKSGDYFVLGEIYAVQQSGFVNLSELRLSGLRAEKLAKVDRAGMIRFLPKAEQKGEIFVFTDVDCGYCQLLHKEVPKLNEMGIAVNYLAFPRGGLNSAAHEKMVSAWCSENRQEAITKLKTGSDLPHAVCENPVDEQYELGNEFGVRGTPAIVLADGTMIPGFKKADELAADLGITN